MIDLRSDTVTKPTPEMREVMMKAEVGDDVFSEDPTVNAFEDKIAKMFDMEAGLFVPSGTMSNQLALNLLTSPGDEVICDTTAHIFNYEATSAAMISGIQLRPVTGRYGVMELPDIKAAVRTHNDWDPHTRVIAVENTTNKGGGACYSKVGLNQIRNLADDHHLSVHIDGARIWNAALATETDFSFYGSIADTMSICFSKGLGAPVGSMLLADKDMIIKARRMRKMLGGGMRQIGILAAAAEYAVDHHLEYLKKDHKRAKSLAKTISQCSKTHIDICKVQSNIVIFDLLEGDAAHALQELKKEGILMVPFGPNTIRATFHFQITDDDMNRVNTAFRKLFS